MKSERGKRAMYIPVFVLRITDSIRVHAESKARPRKRSEFRLASVAHVKIMLQLDIPKNFCKYFCCVKLHIFSISKRCLLLTLSNARL